MSKEQTFNCKTCGKTFQLTEEIYRKAYEGHDDCLSCRKPVSKLQEIEQWFSRISEGPWYADPDKWSGNENLQYWIQNQEDGFACAVRLEDAMFIANAPEWLRYTLDEIKRLTDENDRLIDAANTMYENSEKWRESYMELEVTITRLTEERDMWRKEALQQYPTPKAYDAACTALEKHRKRADDAESLLRQKEEQIERLKDGTP